MKKGFTLIELLAVIVILAIIALIAIPQISNLINDVRAKSLLSSANGLYDSARLYNMKYQNEDTVRFDIENNNITTFADKKLEYKGNIKNAIVVINDIGKVALCVTDGVNSAYKELDDTKVSLAKNRTCSISSALTVNLNNSKKETIKADIEVDNVEALKALSINVDKIVHTKGYYTAGDGGDAYYKIVSTTKNNARYFKIANNNVAELMPQDNTFNVKQFGAKGDGVTDDTESLKETFKAVSGSSLYIPRGTYMVSSVVAIMSDTNIFGDGEESLIMATGDYGVGNDLVKINSKENITINNISISGNIEHNTREMGHSASDGLHMFDIWGSKNITITNCVFKDNVYAALRLVNSTSDVIFKNNKLLNVDCGVVTLGKGTVENLLIEDNYFDGHYQSEPITMYGSGTYKNIIVNNNIIKNKFYGSAIFMGKEGADVTLTDVKITNNKIYNCATGISVKYLYNAIIENNVIDMKDRITDQSGGLGIRVADSNNVKVLNNRVSNTVQVGIQNQHNTNVLFKGNTIQNAGYLNRDFVFALITGENENVVFEENKLIRTDMNLNPYLFSVTASGGVSILNNKLENGKIWLRSTSSNIVVSGNNAEVTDQGTNNIITN